MRSTHRALLCPMPLALALLTLCSVVTAEDVSAHVFDVPLLVEPEAVIVEDRRAENTAYTDNGLDAVRRLTKDGSSAPDDTGRNVRDRDDQTITPMDQSNDPRDLQLTQDIRRALMADEPLSVTAKNIKIITTGGNVTLRGPVNSVENA